MISEEEDSDSDDGVDSFEDLPLDVDEMVAASSGAHGDGHGGMVPKSMSAKFATSAFRTSYTLISTLIQQIHVKLNNK